MKTETIINALSKCDGSLYCDDCPLANENCVQLAVGIIRKLDREIKKLKEEKGGKAD